MREGQNKKSRDVAQKKWVDVVQLLFVKYLDGNLLIELDAVARRWKDLSGRKLNKKNKNQIEATDIVSGPVKDIKREEGEVTVRKLKNTRATGPLGVAV